MGKAIGRWFLGSAARPSGLRSTWTNQNATASVEEGHVVSFLPVPPMSASCTRREFVAAAAQAVAGATFTGWASGLRAAPGQPAADTDGFAIIDAHTHFYDPTRPEGVPWPPRDDKLLYRRVLPKDYRAQPVLRPVTGTMVVEASPWVEDNQWVLDLAAKETFIVGLVGNLPIGTKLFAGHLKRFASNKLFRGIRVRDRKLEGTLDDPAFVSDLKLLADYDLSLDLVGGTEILPFANLLARDSRRWPRFRVSSRITSAATGGERRNRSFR